MDLSQGFRYCAGLHKYVMGLVGEQEELCGGPDMVISCCSLALQMISSHETKAELCVKGLLASHQIQVHLKQLLYATLLHIMGESQERATQRCVVSEAASQYVWSIGFSFQLGGDSQ